MKVEAELKTMYKITVGHDGMCMGQYYPEDDWAESYYNENLKELAEEMSVEYFSGLPTRKFDFEQVQVLLYDDRKYAYETLGEYNPYCKSDDTLKKEYTEFMAYWAELEPERKKMIEVQKAPPVSPPYNCLRLSTGRTRSPPLCHQIQPIHRYTYGLCWITVISIAP